MEELFEEIKAREKPDDASVPLRAGGYFYQWRFASGAQYRTWTRWPVDDPEAVETILDEPRSPTDTSTSPSARCP